MTQTPDPRNITFMPLADLEEDPRNPKDHDLGTIDASMGRFGVLDLIVLDERTGRIISGHGRKNTLEGMEARGETPPDGIQVGEDGRWLAPVVTGWASSSDTEAAAALIAMNRTTELGGWVDESLLSLLDELAEETSLEGIGFDEADLSALDDLVQEGTPEIDGQPDDEEPAPGMAPEEAPKTLAERFGVPPLSIIDTTQGYWGQRKRAWKALGIASEEGRDEGLIYEFTPVLYANFYEIKERAEAEHGPGLSTKEIIQKYKDQLIPAADGGGTSVFDPVLAEILYSWFSKPGDRILDPWAGGSVRGIVASLLGRKYTSVELRPEQIERNQYQWDHGLYSKNIIIGGNHTPPDFTPDLTPVEKHGEIWIKREDRWTRGGASGAKSRAMFDIAKDAEGLVTAGARNSAQIERGALVAQALDIPCRVHVGAGGFTSEMETAAEAGAEVVQANAGYLNVIKKRFRDDADQLSKQGWAIIPFGMEHPTYIKQVSEQTENLPSEASRIVVPYGSGMTLAGVVQGLAERGDERPIIAISVGTADTSLLDTYAPGWEERVTVIEHPSEYSTPAKSIDYEGVRLDPLYEAKCIPYLEPGDALWTVGIRSSSLPSSDTEEGPAPDWILGSSPEKLAEFEPESFDMVIGCPPYYDLEVYSDDPKDLSNMSPEEFDETMAETMIAVEKLLKPDSFAAFVVGNVRSKTAGLLDMRAAMNEAARKAGLQIANLAVLKTGVGTAALRASRGFLGGRSLTPVHQDILVYVKGDRLAAAKRLGQPDMVQFEAEEPEGD